MDFNPLDLLAAAALSDKESSQQSKGSINNSSVTDQNNSEEGEGKNADDDSDNMGKTKRNTLKQPVKVSDVDISCEMSPQKMSWSPEAFLSCLDKPSIEHEKLIIERLDPAFLKSSLKDFTQDEEKEKEMIPSLIEPTCNELEESSKDVVGDVFNSKCEDDQSGVKHLHTEPLDIKPDVSNLVTAIKNEVKVKNESVVKDEKTIDCKDVKVEDIGLSSSNNNNCESYDSKVSMEDLHGISQQERISLDHPYSLIPGKLSLRSPDAYNEEDVDVCSDSSPLTEDSEQRSRNFSLDSTYLKSAICEGKAAGTPQLPHISNSHLLQKLQSPFKSPCKDDGSVRPDTSAFNQVGVVSPERPGPSCGKYRIGTFASFSSSNLELEKYLRGFDGAPIKKESEVDHSSIANKIPPFSQSLPPLLQSPTPDWDRSEAGSETHDDSSDAKTPHRLSPDFTTEHVDEWIHSMYHDHDYCLKLNQRSVADDIKLPFAKRKYTKRKNKVDAINHEKIMKAKYLKKELLKDSFPNTPSQPMPDTSLSSTDPSLKANPVGRPRKRPLEKPVEEEIDPATGAKMKITGKFKDDYVYYLSKSKSTSRRRQTPTLPLLTDKIIVPAPKPGDIIVPHLTDADIEIIRTKGRNALDIPGRPYHPLPCILPSHSKSIPSSLPVSQSLEASILDVDSHIVSTILSMENDNLASPSSSQSHDFSQNSDLCNGHVPMNTDSNMSPEEQVLNYLLSVEDPSSLLPSTAGFPPLPLPQDPLYSKIDHFSDSIINHPQTSQHNSELLSSPSVLAHFDPSISVLKSDAETNSLPDDLSLLISQSQIASTSNTSQEFNSQSSEKSELCSDLTSLGTPNLSSSALKLSSIEKTLDYLGVKDGEIRLEPEDIHASNLASIDIPPPLQPPPQSTILGDDDTPWIVTVTLYFNDVPALMVFNEPYIRLVDIHKQILPAKDTGILKKRCQLLNIPVQNCTEMHRYFLVQYGKAYNSKSTLIISKVQATDLVGYYASPQPRVGRSEDPNARRQSCGSSMSPVTVPAETAAASNPKRRPSVKTNTKKVQPSLGIPSPDINVTSIKEDQAVPVNGLNKRTRHKKVNYLDMLKGEEREKTSTNTTTPNPNDSIIQAIESVLKATTDHSVKPSKIAKVKTSLTNKSSSKKGHETVTATNDLDNKKKKAKDIRRKSTEAEKKSKGNVKLVKSRAKGSNSRIKKKQDKLDVTDSELCVDNGMLSVCDGHESMNKSNNNRHKPLKLKVNSLINLSPTSQRKQSSSLTSPSTSSSYLNSNPSKKSLFSCSNPTFSHAPPSDRPLRVLAVAHQAAISKGDEESHLPSQPADIHLDLFTKSSSACVRCHTCSQFLSVPHFMRHHHVPMDNEWLATEAAHRILVPRNKENISDEERRLWEEFHSLQEAIGGFGEADDYSDSDNDSDSDSDYGVHGHGGASSLETSGASFLSMDTSSNFDSSFNNNTNNNVNINSHQTRPSSQLNGSTNISNGSAHFSNVLDSSSNGSCSIKSKIALLNQKQDADTIVDVGNAQSGMFNEQPSSVSSSCPKLVGMNQTQDSTSNSNSNVRTSSRRRKSKQLFSIENYCTNSPQQRKSLDNETSLNSSAGV